MSVTLRWMCSCYDVDAPADAVDSCAAENVAFPDAIDVVATVPLNFPITSDDLGLSGKPRESVTRKLTFCLRVRCDVATVEGTSICKAWLDSVIAV